MPAEPPKTGFLLSGEKKGDIPVRANNDWVSTPAVDLAWPVGSVYISTTATTAAQVAERLGGGTWTALGPGRVLIGIDSTQAEYDTLKETGGAETVTPGSHSVSLSHTGMSISDHPAHLHNLLETETAQAGINASESPSNTENNSAQSHTFDPPDTHSDTLSHSAVSVVQPYIVVSMWERTE